MSDMEATFSSYSKGMASCLRQIRPGNLFDPSACEALVQIGVFFDGTNNNRAEDEPDRRDSNIARLSRSYKHEPSKGLFNLYIPGVGTSFPQIGEEGKSDLGSGFAIGCEARVLYGILSVLNSLHHATYGEAPLLSPVQVKALCRGSIADIETLSRLGYSKCLLESHARTRMLGSLVGKLQSKLHEKKQPRIKECMIDVFGFSRGAAEARVFCNWLDKLFSGGGLAKVPTRIRFLGIFDTVASAGFLNALSSTATNSTDGHSGWASPDSLVVPSSVENCVHFLAMHELRKNFPIDEIGVNGVLGEGHVQVAYPGSHSDVGGGYAGGELGMLIGKDFFESDSLKLSQIPLNHMFSCAVACGVPLNKETARRASGSYDPFATSPLTTQAFVDFMIESGSKKRPLREWMQPYLNWRWQIRDTYQNSLHFKRAGLDDRKLLLQGNSQLIKDAALLMGNGIEARGSDERTSVLARIYRNKSHGRAGVDAIRLGYMDDEATKVLAEARRAPPVSRVLVHLFENFVHDSYAGFTKTMVEPSGYWRHRKAFKGSERLFLASANKADSEIA